MTEKCWYRLNVDTTNAIKPDWKFPNPQFNVYGVWQLWAHEVFRPEWLEYTASLGLHFGSLMLFYRDPWMSTKGAHIDIAETDPKLKIGTYGLNWILGGAGSEMIWYNMPKGDIKIQYTPANTAYTYWPLDQLQEIDRCAIGLQPVLVKVGTPHSIKMGAEPRWCISARPRLRANMEWDEAVEQMKSLNLLVER